jgi:aspartate aminotransferase
MKMELARRSNILPSLTLAMNTKAKQMKARGIDVISFAAGEPDFTTPRHVKDAGIRAIEENKTYYTPASGIIELKQEIVRKLKNENGLDYLTEQITVNSGAKHSVFNVLAVLIEEGDEVIIPAPYWVSYSEMVRILGGENIIIPTTEDSGFKITPNDLDRVMGPRTKVFLLNSPCNPTGSVYTRQELFSLAEYLENKDVVIISDEIYEKILYDGKTHESIANFSENTKNHTVLVNGVSKAFSMTGWRIGYAAGPEYIIGAVNKLQGHTSGNAASISQWASMEALKGDFGFFDSWITEFKKRRDYIVDELNSIPGISCSKPEGAFYVFPNVSKLYGKVLQGEEIKDSVGIAAYLLEYGKIAVVPGRAFGADNYIRISFATSMENIVEGIKRLRDSVLV